MNKERCNIKLGNKLYTRRAVKRYRNCFVALGIAFILVGIFFVAVSFVFTAIMLLFSAYSLIIALSYNSAIKMDIIKEQREIEISNEKEFNRISSDIESDLAHDVSSVMDSEKPKYNYEKFYVAGVHFRQDAIESLPHVIDDMYKSSSARKYENECRFDKVYQYDFHYYDLNLDIQHEPDNAEDPDAMKVMINDVHVGYIKSDDLDRFDVLANIGPKGVVIDILGGKYKLLDYDDLGNPVLESGRDDYYIILTFRY